MKKLLYILLLSPLFFISSCEEETPPNEENQCYYNNVQRTKIVRKTTDGGFILYGNYNISNDNRGAIIIKTDASGEEEWRQHIDNSLEVLDANQTTDDGHILLLNNYDDKLHLAKTDAYGAEEWHLTYTYNEYELRPKSIKQTTDGSYIVTGKVWDRDNTTDLTNSVNEVFLIKVNSNGELEWEKMYTINDNELGLWNTANDATEVQQTIDGGYIMVGAIRANGTPYIYLIKTDSNGNELWTYIDLEEEINLKSIQQTVDGGYIVCGGIGDLDGRSIVLKISSNGENKEWSETYSEFGSEAVDIKPTSDGGYIIVGNIWTGDYNSEWYFDRQFLLKINNTGQEEWSKTYYDENQFYSIQQTVDGGYIVGGAKENRCGLLMKTDSEGNVQFIL